MKSKMRYAVPTALFALAALGATPALAQEDDDDEGGVGEVMMQVAPDVEDGEVTFARDIQLPEHAADEAHTNAQDGLDTANEARGSGAALGQERASEARDLGRNADEVNAAGSGDNPPRP